MPRIANPFRQGTDVGDQLAAAMMALFPGPEARAAMEERHARAAERNAQAEYRKAVVEDLRAKREREKAAEVARMAAPDNVVKAYFPGSAGDEVLRYRGAGGTASQASVEAPPIVPRDDEGYSMPLETLARPAGYTPARENVLADALAGLALAAGTRSNAEQIAKAGETMGTARNRADIISGTDPGRIAQAYFATSGKAPFSDSQGRVLDVSRGTLNEGGQQALANVGRTNAAAAEDRAQAGAHNRTGRTVVIADPLSPTGFQYTTPERAVGQAAPAPGSAGGGALGKPSPGFQWKPDGQGGFLPEQQPIPGGPVDLKNRQAAEKQRLAAESAMRKADILGAKVDEALKQVGPLTTGAGSFLAAIPGTPQHDLGANLETIKAIVGFEELRDMRAASPTGGALGGIAVRELDFLQSAIASLKQSQTPKQLKANLAKVKEHFANWSRVMRENQAMQGNAIPTPGASPGAPVDFADLPD